MQISVQEGEGLIRRMTVELPAEVIHQEVDKRLKDMARTARMNGFRPGKVPVRLLRGRFGSKLTQEIFVEQISTSLPQALTQAGLTPLEVPQIMPSEDPSRFVYIAEFEVRPKITLVPLNNYSVHHPQAQVTDADVTARLAQLQNQIPDEDVVGKTQVVRQRMELELAQQIQNTLKHQIINILLAAHTVQLPTKLLQKSVEHLRMLAQKRGDTQLQDQWFEEQGKRQIASQLIMEEIVREQHIQLDEARLQRVIQDRSPSPEERAAIESLVLEDQVMEWVLSQVQVVDVPSSFSTLLAP